MWCHSLWPCHTKLGYKALRKSISVPHFCERKSSRRCEEMVLLKFGAHGQTRTAGLLLTKEVLEDHFSSGALLRSNTGAIANNRCLAALPRKSIRRLENGW